MNTLIYAFLGLLTSNAVTGLLIVNSTLAQQPRTGQDLHHISAQATPPRRGMMAQEVDRHFIEMMIPHHEDAVEMAKLALSRAQHPEIKKLAEAIKTDQTREIEQMRAWYKKWYGTEVPVASTAGMGMMGTHYRMGSGGMMGTHHRMGSGGMMGMRMHPDMEMHLDTLRDASNFDQAFIREMIPHHQMAVMMSRMAQGSATHPEIRNLAESIIKTQTTEIEQMRQWYQVWYR